MSTNCLTDLSIDTGEKSRCEKTKNKQKEKTNVLIKMSIGTGTKLKVNLHFIKGFLNVLSVISKQDELIITTTKSVIFANL